jgi:hypothetical protein
LASARTGSRPPLKNRLAWSFSRMRTFDSCRRRYYYQHYLKWGGWDHTAPAESRAAYRLSRMTSADQLAGELVHRGIEDALRRFRSNRLTVEAEELVAWAVVQWERRLAESASGRWEHDPKHVTCLVEDYYSLPDRERRLERGRERVEVCLRSFCASRTWEELRRGRTQNWMATDGDPYETVEVLGIPTYGRPDFAYDASPPAEPKSRLRLFDWKTGSPRDSDILQVRFYALAAEGRWGFPPLAVRARLVYLFPSAVEQTVEVTPEGLEDGKRALAESWELMKSVLADVDENIPLGIEHFPVTDRPGLCYRCPFQEICADRPAATAARDLLREEDDFDPFV